MDSAGLPDHLDAGLGNTFGIRCGCVLDGTERILIGEPGDGIDRKAAEKMDDPEFIDLSRRSFRDAPPLPVNGNHLDRVRPRLPMDRKRGLLAKDGECGGCRT